MPVRTDLRKPTSEKTNCQWPRRECDGRLYDWRVCGSVSEKSSVTSLPSTTIRTLSRIGPAAARIALQVVPEHVRAVRDLGKLLARLLFCVVEHVGDAGADRVHAVAVDEGPDALFGARQPGDHGLDVAPVLIGDAAVRHDQIQQFAVQLAAAEQLGDGDPEAFLVDLLARGRDAARHDPAHVRGVHERPRVADDAARRERRASTRRCRAGGWPCRRCPRRRSR